MARKGEHFKKHDGIDAAKRQSSHAEPLEPEAYIEAGFTRAESEINLRKLLDMLPEKQREVVVLRYVQELKLAQRDGS